MELKRICWLRSNCFSTLIVISFDTKNWSRNTLAGDINFDVTHIFYDHPNFHLKWFPTTTTFGEVFLFIHLPIIRYQHNFFQSRDTFGTPLYSGHAPLGNNILAVIIIDGLYWWVVLYKLFIILGPGCLAVISQLPWPLFRGGWPLRGVPLYNYSPYCGILLSRLQAL